MENIKKPAIYTLIYTLEILRYDSPRKQNAFSLRLCFLSYNHEHNFKSQNDILSNRTLKPIIKTCLS